MPVADLRVHRNGLLVEVSLGPSAPLRALLWKQSKPVPPAISATFLVDTGADTTMVSEQFMRSLGLAPTSQTRVITSTTGTKGEVCDVYGIELILLPHVAQPRRWGAVEVLARPLLNQGTDGLLGRDLLAQLVLTYDGPRAAANITY